MSVNHRTPDGVGDVMKVRTLVLIWGVLTSELFREALTSELLREALVALLSSTYLWRLIVALAYLQVQYLYKCYMCMVW
jgi:hypothetical protein